MKLKEYSKKDFATPNKVDEGMGKLVAGGAKDVAKNLKSKSLKV